MSLIGLSLKLFVLSMSSEEMLNSESSSRLMNMNNQQYKLQQLCPLCH